ncbi:translation initiation factor IF-2-like isoform X2 [Rissa tridactyla]|uniref:translation initiation factor IF-2-like isoform X2 n=1 Tax=Rissa tridactyla TaxID=75485 RepID=UPI0023BA5441|nr:translation initiation factor IF-2-like isoform X2 [Rissa tridactyla]
MGARRGRAVGGGAAPLRKRRGPGQNGGRVEAGAGRRGGKAGPGGRVLGRAGSSEPPRARREASGPRPGSPSASREEDPARLIPLAARATAPAGAGRPAGELGDAADGPGTNLQKRAVTSPDGFRRGFSDLPESAGNCGKANAGTRNENLGYERSFRRKRGRGRGRGGAPRRSSRPRAGTRSGLSASLLPPGEGPTRPVKPRAAKKPGGSPRGFGGARAV